MTDRPRGDVARFNEFARLHEPYLHMIALRLTGDKDAAKDLVQETLLRAFLHFDQLEQGGNARAWLTRVLTNLFLDDIKHAKVVKNAAVQLNTLEVVARDLDVILLETSDAALRDAIGALEVEEREVVELCYLQSAGYKEAADRLHIPIGTVGSRLKRARERLKQRLSR